ncbi:non-hydrolyzing UDP-N-acetylglucosamine 2-epimerase [Fulvivirga lutea]|uniref:UDP-N-acetylglucosamine 2-epimerase (Non-hydrolyzing) n=1 Tax=Fulvivirga lutea TaxID=2810512 RepID=A0A974WK19_9BACT|nr:UDP-N-acetylglucosamine 2-epimerase (non-hydrolyzing) [Fulvivirga lutea]QSE96798.1 UDP-N-acetylglucosamine 2-epimerase (non-hydrolyzing) [Fulvivirga lutea]
MHLVIVAGARPNFMKVAPIIKEIKKRAGVGYSLIHTGQHYDKEMSNQFFDELGIPEPNVNLGAGGGSQAEQTAAIMIGFEKYITNSELFIDCVIVVGDVTSTLACTIVAKKLNIKVAHVEGGIRSGDMTMPEEINRMVTDSISDYFFTTSRIANENLSKSGVSKERVFFVGNTMIDTLLSNLEKLKQPAIWKNEGLKNKKYVVLTMHRPSNVDDGSQFKLLIELIINHLESTKIIFPVHPRTKKVLDELNINSDNLIISRPLGYLEFNYLVKNAMAVITDSGGITEEATVLGIPCITLRNSTERPETCDVGTNELAGTDTNKIIVLLDRLKSGKWKKGGIPELWDGKTAERIIDNLESVLK